MTGLCFGTAWGGAGFKGVIAWCVLSCDIACDVQTKIECQAVDALGNTRAGKVFHWFVSDIVAEQARATKHSFVA